MRNRLLTLLLLALLLAGSRAHARRGPEPPRRIIPFELVDAWYLPDSTLALPFTRAGNLILVKGRADTTEGNFILDSGAPNLVLNITYFRDYPITQNPEGEQTGITGSGGAISRTQVKSFHLGHLKYSRLEADLANLGHIENSKNIRILGLLGMELFKQCELIFDFEKNLILLHRMTRKEASTYKNPLLADPSTYTEIPIEWMDNRILTTVELGGKKLKFVIDCAAEANVLDSRLPNQIFELVSITGRIQLGGSGGSKIEALKGDLKGFEIGGQSIATLPVLITNLEKTCFAYAGCIDGILGFDFLALHKVGFNFVTRKMYLWK